MFILEAASTTTIWLEGWHYSGDLFNGNLGVGGLYLVVRSVPVIMILQPKFLNCVRSHVDLLYLLRAFA